MNILVDDFSHATNRRESQNIEASRAQRVFCSCRQLNNCLITQLTIIVPNFIQLLQTLISNGIRMIGKKTRSKSKSHVQFQRLGNPSNVSLISFFVPLLSLNRIISPKIICRAFHDCPLDSKINATFAMHTCLSSFYASSRSIEPN